MGQPIGMVLGIVSGTFLLQMEININDFNRLQKNIPSDDAHSVVVG